MKFKKLLILVPTRNRAEMAINSVRSILIEETSEIEVIVSDNSTDEDELRNLKNFCDDLGNQRLKYIRPPEPLSMSKHWEWAKDQALQDSDVSHVCYLTDRMMFRKNALKELLAIAKRYPGNVITYSLDSINDSELPVILRQTAWTGNLFEIDADSIIKISADSIWHNSTPRMFNCIVPRETLLNILKKYGVVFESVSPDFCFLYKFLDTETNFLNYDKPLMIEYGMKRSNGNNYGKGFDIKDTNSFFEDLAKNKMGFNQDSPVPEFHTVINAIVNEYCFVRQRSSNTKFPPLKMLEYFRANRTYFDYIENDELKQKMLKIYRGKIREHNLTEKVISEELPVSQRIKNSSLKKVLSGALMMGESKIWGSKFANLPFRMDGKYSKFNSVEDAINESNKHPIAKRKGMSDLEYLLDKNFTRRNYV